MDEVFGAQLRTVRLERNMTQAELAELAGCGEKKHISYYECGHKDIRLSTLRKLADALGVPAWRLLEEEQA